MTLGYEYRDIGRVSLLVRNMLDEDPVIMGNATVRTAAGTGNTFAQLFDTMGRTYMLNLKFTF